MPADDDSFTVSSREAAMDRRVQCDRMMGLLALAMWGGTAVKCAPSFAMRNNLQSAVGLTAIIFFAIVWPSFYVESYKKRRISAMAFLQFFLFALPFTYDREAFDIICPLQGFGLAATLFQLYMGTRIALLLFTSVGWRLPFRYHLMVHTAKVALLVRYGVKPFCMTKLLASPQIDSAVSGVHSIMASLALPLMPPAASFIPKGMYSKRVAMLLMSWALLGWLLPALLLLPKVSGRSPSRVWSRSDSNNGANSGRWSGAARKILLVFDEKFELLLWKVSSCLESMLYSLIPIDLGERERQALPAEVLCLVRWWVLVVAVWGMCCAFSRMFPEDTGILVGVY